MCTQMGKIPTRYNSITVVLIYVKNDRCDLKNYRKFYCCHLRINVLAKFLLINCM